MPHPTCHVSDAPANRDMRGVKDSDTSWMDQGQGFRCGWKKGGSRIRERSLSTLVRRWRKEGPGCATLKPSDDKLAPRAVYGRSARTGFGFVKPGSFGPRCLHQKPGLPYPLCHSPRQRSSSAPDSRTAGPPMKWQRMRSLTGSGEGSGRTGGGTMAARQMTGSRSHHRLTGRGPGGIGDDPVDHLGR
jgi:hypothetical protein